MAVLHSLSPLPSLLPTPSNLFSTQLPKLPFKFRRIPIPVLLRCSQPKPSVLTAEQQQNILEAVAESNEKLLPGVRTYENNSARLTLVGAVDFQQALTAAAADGGRAADEHIVAGVRAMVVETVFPGPPDEHSTVSTRLFLPARKVKEKALKLKDSLNEDILSSTASKNILAMTFRQVVMEQLWSFELVAFAPGSRRNMNDLESPREVPASFTVSSSNEQVISVLAEVICLCALESVERKFSSCLLERWWTKFFPWFQKPKRIVSKDSSVILEKLLENEIVTNAKNLVEAFSLEREKYRSMGEKSGKSWWTLSSYSELEKIGGPELAAWVCENIPAYRLQIDVGKLENVKFEGGKLFAENSWEILLTHAQMVNLANTLDAYYEDVFTLPDKHLSCGAVMKPANLSTNKSISPIFKMSSATLASGLFLLTISILSRLYMPTLPSWRKYPEENSALQSCCIRCLQPKSLEPTKLESLCTSVIRRIKDFFDWPGEIVTESTNCAWMGDLPLYLRRTIDIESSSADISSSPFSLEKSVEEMEGSVQDIASYQVVLSTDGKIVGFQPTSRVAVNHWASNPLAEELYGQRNLSPGLIEPRLKISYPNDVLVLELLMSSNPESRFALVRPVDIAESVCGQ